MRRFTWPRMLLVVVIVVETVAMLALIGYRGFRPPDNPEDVALGIDLGTASGFVWDVQADVRDFARHYTAPAESSLHPELTPADLREKLPPLLAAKTGTDTDGYSWKATGYLLAITDTGDPDFPDGRLLVTIGVYVEATVDEATVTAGMCADINLTVGQLDERPLAPADCTGQWGKDGRPVPEYDLMH